VAAANELSAGDLRLRPMISNFSIYVLVGCAAALILGAAYLGLRGDPIETSPPESAPVEGPSAKKISAESSVDARGMAQALPAAAPADAAAPNSSDASRFEFLRHCFHASQDLATAKSVGDCKVYEGRQEFEQAYAECLNGWKDWKNRAAVAEKTLAGCSDVTDIEKQYYEATRAAAAAGDPDAQLCYLEFDFNLSRTSSVIGDADHAEYKQVSPTYVDAGIKRGDWRVVYLLTRRSGPVTQLDRAGNPETVYRTTKLLRHGATGAFATGLDYKLKRLKQPNLKPEAALPAKVIQEGDAWAQETYNTYFSGVPGLTELPTICDRS
jgi:hypothetical protein